MMLMVIVVRRSDNGDDGDDSNNSDNRDKYDNKKCQADSTVTLYASTSIDNTKIQDEARMIIDILYHSDHTII